MPIITLSSTSKVRKKELNKSYHSNFINLLFHLLQNCLECVNGVDGVGVDAVDAVHLQAGHIADGGVTGSPAAHPEDEGPAA